MRRIVDAMDRAIAAGDPLHYSSLNGRFHHAIGHASHHATLDHALTSLHFPLIRYQFRTVLSPGRKEASLAEHHEILAALLDRDGPAAERAMRRHLTRVGTVLGKLGDAAQP